MIPGIKQQLVFRHRTSGLSKKLSRTQALSAGDNTPASSQKKNEDAKGGPGKLQESTPVQQDEINTQNSESGQTPTPRAQERQDKNKDKVNPLAAFMHVSRLTLQVGYGYDSNALQLPLGSRGPIWLVEL
jgi:hypothetical protein